MVPYPLHHARRHNSFGHELDAIVFEAAPEFDVLDELWDGCSQPSWWFQAGEVYQADASGASMPAMAVKEED